MALMVDDEWIRSNRCPQTAMGISDGRWVLSWHPGSYQLRQAIAAMRLAENGDLETDPAAVTPTSDA
ncbi:hypothetical protein GCM10023195_14980 [Actinoallomurus liliacearum]|uniref:Uncharacterized protein n=1 Tax=Actinoallomurus liliacearum TaxID=1080073 RepID=A0ABP8TFU6_9ACTN